MICDQCGGVIGLDDDGDLGCVCGAACAWCDQVLCDCDTWAPVLRTVVDVPTRGLL